MPVPVQTDLVSGGGDGRRQLRVAVDLFPHEEERGARSSIAEQLESRRSPLPVRPVVKRERYPLRRRRQRPLQTKSVGERRG